MLQLGKKEIEWPSEKDKYEAIGFLARKGVIQNIEANVPTKFIERFKERFKGKYTNNQPYDVGTKKGGEQYRITLNHLYGCPIFLKSQVDGITKVRINATAFIRELVNDYGFIFSCSEQNGELIKSIVQEKGKEEYRWFKSTYYPNSKFLEELNEKVDEKQEIILAENFKKVIKNINSKSGKTKQVKKMTGGVKFSDEELSQLGWIGEKLFYNLIMEKNKDIFNKLELDYNAEIKVNWFNKGFDSQQDWCDKSIGKGYDMDILCGRKKLLLEIKSSKKKPGYFSMTGKELLMMEKKAKQYYIIKINMLENLFSKGKVEIEIYKNPCQKFFRTEKIKSVTFIIEGDENE